MTRPILFLLVLALPILAGCNTQAGSAEDPDAAENALSKTPTWVLSKLELDGEDRPLKPGERATISFKKDEIDGNSGCNHLFGKYTAKPDGTFVLSEYGGTEMACEHLNFEMTFVEAFAAATKYEVADGKLVLSDAAGTNVLEFVPFEPNHLPLAGTDWRLTHFTESDAVTSSASGVLDKHPITLTIEDGKATGSAGCNGYEGRFTKGEGDKLTFGELEVTLKACNPDAMQQETKFVQTLPKMTTFRVNETVMTLENADGSLGLQFEGVKPQ